MAKPKDISHPGIVTRVSPDTIEVRIEVTSLCAACHAKGFCSLSEVAEKSIAIPNRGQAVQEGDRVQVILQSGLGLAAVGWAYLFPLLLLLIILLLLHRFNISDLHSAIGAIIILVIYYSLIWRFRNTFKKKYTFAIEKI